MRTMNRPASARSAGRRPPVRLLAALTVALLGAGCGSDGDSMTDPGDGSGNGNGNGNGDGTTATFSVTVTGAESFVSNGTYAYSGGTAAENGWEVNLASLDGTNPLQMLRVDGEGDRPGPGTYPIVSVAGQAGPGEFYGRCTTTAGETYYATAGTLTITSSTDAVVEGTFAFPAESPGGAMVDVSGSFRADDLLDE